MKFIRETKHKRNASKIKKMSEKCVLDNCKNVSCAVCQCCRKNLCLAHLKAHEKSFVSPLKPLEEKLASIEQRLNSFEFEQLTDVSNEKLDEWRLSCQKKIDDFFAKKSEDLRRSAKSKFDEQHQSMSNVRTHFNQLLEKQVSPEDLTDSYFEMTPLKTIDCPKANGAALATNNELILFCQRSNLCLVNREFQLIETIPWKSAEITDIFWSVTLERFFVLHQNEIFLFDHRSKTFEKLQLTTKQNWACGNCSRKSLFLATYQRASTIMEFKLLPKIEFVKQWKSSEICSKEEAIHDIKIHNENLCLIVENQVRTNIRVDLRSTINFNRVWSLSLDKITNEKVQIRCCSLKNAEWMVVHHDSSSLFYIDRRGSLKKRFTYTPSPHFVSSFNDDALIIVTSNSINFHQIQ